MNPEEIRARLAAIRDEHRGIHELALAEENRALTEDEVSRWEELDTERQQLETTLSEMETRQAREDRIAAARAQFGSFHTGTVVPTDDVDVRSLSAAEARDRALKRADEARAIVTFTPESERQLERLMRVRNADLDGSLIARRLLYTENEHYRSAFAKAVTSPTPAWTAEEARAIADFREFEQRAMAEGANTSGGFGIPVTIDPSIILTSQQSLNPFRRISRVEHITGPVWRGVSSAGVSWSYDGEATEVSDDSPTLAQPEIYAELARGFVPYSVEVGQDYPGLADELARLLAEGKDELEAQKFAVGAGHGSKEPLGIVTALDADTNVEVVVTTDGGLGIVDIDKVWRALPDRAKANATWVMGSGTASTIASLGDAYGTRTVDLAGNLEKLRLRPVEPATYIPDFAGVTTAQNLLVVGDFRKFVIVERIGMSIELVPHLFGTTNNRPTSQRGWIAYARNGSGPVDLRAFRLLQNQ